MSFNTIKVNNTDTNYTHSIFDISEYNSGAIYANLSAALAAVPQNKQQVGMSVKFIQQVSPARYSVVKTENLETEPTGTLLSEAPYIDSGTYDESQLRTIFSTLPSDIGAENALTYYVAVTVDETTTYTSWVITKVLNSSNKYVQYRLMSNTFSTTESDWQGVDDEPTPGSDNLVKSGGVYDAISQLWQEVDDVMPHNKVYKDYTDIVTLRYGTYTPDTKEYTDGGNRRVVCVSYLPIPYIAKYEATKLRITIGANFNIGRQLLSTTFEDISGVISVGSALLFNDSAWRSGTVEIDLTQYPTAKTFGFVIKATSERKLLLTEDFGLKIELYCNEWVSIDERIAAAVEGVDVELQEIRNDINEIYTTPTSYELENIGSTLARGQFSVIPGHNYIVKVAPWDYTGQVIPGNYILVFEDGYRSEQVSAGTAYPSEIPPYYQFTPTQSVVGVSSRGVVGSVTKMEIIDNDDTNEGILNQTIKRVDALETEEEGSGDYNYVGEKIDLIKRTYNKDAFLVTTSNDFTVIKDAIVTQMGKSLVMQSCAVYGKYFVRAYQYGGIAIYDLETKSLVADFMLPLPSADLLTLHASNISFGIEFPSGNSTFPALYVCETTGQRRCFVFDLTLSSATLLQTISFDGTWGTGNDYRDFIVDSQNRCLWIVGYYNYNVSGNYTICKKVDLRSISSPTIVYGDSDVQQSFEIRDINVIQGVFIWNDHMYIGDQRRWIVNIDLIQGKEVGHIDFSSFMGELEGLANYNGDLLVDNSTVYKLSLY